MRWKEVLKARTQIYTVLTLGSFYLKSLLKSDMVRLKEKGGCYVNLALSPSFSIDHDSKVSA